MQRLLKNWVIHKLLFVKTQEVLVQHGVTEDVNVPFTWVLLKCFLVFDQKVIQHVSCIRNKFHKISWIKIVAFQHINVALCKNKYDVSLRMTIVKEGRSVRSHYPNFIVLNCISLNFVNPVFEKLVQLLLLSLENNFSADCEFEVLASETTSLDSLLLHDVDQVGSFSFVPINLITDVFGVHFVPFFAAKSEKLKNFLQILRFGFGHNEGHFERGKKQKLFSGYWISGRLPFGAQGVVEKEHVGGVAESVVDCLLLVQVLDPVQVLDQDRGEVHVHTSEVFQEGQTD